MSTQKPPAILADGRAESILRAVKEWYPAGEATGSHPLWYFARLFSNSLKLRLLQTSVNDAALRSPDQREAITGLFLPSPHYIELEITSVTPAQAWVGDSVTVNFRIQNRLLEATSGVLTADITQGLQTTLAGTGFQGSAVRVAQLEPGQVSNGIIVLKQWRAVPSFVEPGSHNVWLQYWVEDQNGTISVVYGDLGPNQTVVTYNSIAIASGDIDIYPACAPHGPDYLAVSSFGVDPDRVFTGGSGNILAPGQHVKLTWSVAGGGFPATDQHPGSVSGVTLNFPLFQGTVPASGAKTINVSNELAAPYTPIEATLTATGNCGKVESSLSVLAIPPWPLIVTFSASPPSVLEGNYFTLYWDIRNFPWGKNQAFAWLLILEYKPDDAKGNVVYSAGLPNGPNAPAKGFFRIKAVADHDYELWVYTQSIHGTGLVNNFKRIAVKLESGIVATGYSGISFYNCSDLQHQFHVWVKDLTTNADWIEKVAFESQWDPQGLTCPVDQNVFTTIKFDTTGHDYEVRVTDPGAVGASGRNDPEDGSAIRWISSCHALATGPLVGLYTVA